MKQLKLRDGSLVQFDGAHYAVVQGPTKTTLDGAISQAINNGILDADGAFFFQRQLEQIKARSYDVQYAELQARMLFPVSNEGGPGITSITYRTYDQIGAAKIIQA